MHNSNDIHQLYTNAPRQSNSPSASEYSDVVADSDDEFDEVEEVQKNEPLLPYQNTLQPSLSDCGLCGRTHHGGECVMIERSEDLAEYREMLIFHADDEPWEERVCLLVLLTFLFLLTRCIKCTAVQSIDQILLKRGHVHLVAGQPLHPLPKPVPGPPAAKAVKNAQTGKSKEGHAPSEEQKLKRAIPMPPSPCVLCHSNTPHHYKDCQVVRAGSKRFVLQGVTNMKTSLITAIASPMLFKSWKIKGMVYSPI